jgi:phage baseplate assembly protein W
VGVYRETIDIRSPFFARLTDDQAILAQAVLMRLQTARGTLWTDPTYGLNVSDYVNADLTPDEVARLPLEVKAELEKEERIAAVTVAPKFSRSSSGVKLYLDVRVTPSATKEFSMTLAVTDLSVELLLRGNA